MRTDSLRCLVRVALAVFLAGGWIVGRSSLMAFRSSPAQEPSSFTATSVLEGVFTLDQATRGQRTFQIECSSCHTLADHTGAKFAEKWVGSSVGDMFDLISNTMPDGNPGSLEPEGYASIIAFLLKENGYPAGKEALPASTAALMKVRVEPLAPGRGR